MNFRLSACAMTVLLAAGQGFGAGPETAKVTPWVMARTAAGGQAEFLVVMGDQADLTPARAMATKAAKGRFVYDALYQRAQQAQAGVLGLLAARGVPHRSYYIVNAIWVRGDRALALELAARPEVAQVIGNPEMRIDLPRPEEGIEESPSSPEVPTVIEEGITFVRAPEVWAAGFTGQGRVVAGADTGIRWTHQALRPQYRGWNGTTADHNFNWHDSIHPPATGGICGADTAAPCDDNGHGTHTVGTAVGDDGAANEIGMAPGAKFIGCRNMDQGNGTPARYIECFEFFLAPYPIGGTPGQGNPLLAPDVSVNSWGCPPSEGCDAANMELIRQAVAAQRAAGIVTGASAGNAGSACSTVADPPGMHDESFSVGALNCPGNVCSDNLAAFSSRGPVTIDGSGRVKPDIVAPGTSVRSATNGSDTAYTSPQARRCPDPHVSGSVALLLSGVPVAGRQRERHRGAPHGHRGAQRGQLDRAVQQHRGRVSQQPVRVRPARHRLRRGRRAP